MASSTAWRSSLIASFAPGPSAPARAPPASGRWPSVIFSGGRTDLRSHIENGNAIATSHGASSADGGSGSSGSRGTITSPAATALHRITLPSRTSRAQVSTSSAHSVALAQPGIIEICASGSASKRVARRLFSTRSCTHAIGTPSFCMPNGSVSIGIRVETVTRSRTRSARTVTPTSRSASSSSATSTKVMPSPSAISSAAATEPASTLRSAARARLTSPAPTAETSVPSGKTRVRTPHRSAVLG